MYVYYVSMIILNIVLAPRKCTQTKAAGLHLRKKLVVCMFLSLCADLQITIREIKYTHTYVCIELLFEL